MSELNRREQVLEDLNSKIPREVISERSGGGGRNLSYLEGWYVINRLNELFTPMGWDLEMLDVRSLEGPKPSYIVKVKLIVRLGAQVTFKEAYGYGSDKSGNNPHELAIKEARTDALKVAAKDLGMSMGLALYDKSQEFVGEVDKTEVVAKVGKILESTDLQSQVKLTYKELEKMGKISQEKFKSNIKSLFGKEKLAELDKEELEFLVAQLEELKV